MGNTCKPMAVSFQCMTKFTTNKKKIKKKVICPKTLTSSWILLSHTSYLIHQTILSPLPSKHTKSSPGPHFFSAVTLSYFSSVFLSELPHGFSYFCSFSSTPSSQTSPLSYIMSSLFSKTFRSSPLLLVSGLQGSTRTL